RLPDPRHLRRLSRAPDRRGRLRLEGARDAAVVLPHLPRASDRLVRRRAARVRVDTGAADLAGPNGAGSSRLRGRRGRLVTPLFDAIDRGAFDGPIILAIALAFFVLTERARA